MNFFEFAKRGQDFDDRPPIWLDDASVLRHQLETNLKRTIPDLMFGWGSASLLPSNKKKD